MHLMHHRVTRVEWHKTNVSLQHNGVLPLLRKLTFHRTASSLALYRAVVKTENNYVTHYISKNVRTTFTHLLNEAAANLKVIELLESYVSIQD